jgi:glycosyltransferase involved in cell wall biosynthesis
VLTSNVSAMPEVAGSAALLVDPGNTPSIADGLRKLTGDPALRAELVLKGLERSGEFSWEKAVRSTWAVYEELLH